MLSQSSPVDYSAPVRERFAHPSNAGRLDPSPEVVSVSAGSVDQGARFTLDARVADGCVQQLKYRVYGCPHCIAAASLASEQLTGATPERLAKWGWREVAQVLEVPAEKRGRLLILEDAVRALGRAWQALP